MGLIKALGLDVRILFAQLLNFSVLVFVLWRFAYKPVLNILEDRRLKIKQGIDDAEEATKNLSLAVEDRKKIILKARKEASQLIENAQQQALIKQNEIIAKAKEDINAMMEKEKNSIKIEKEVTLSEIKGEVSALIVLGLQKFLTEKLDDERDHAVIKRSIKDLI